MKLRMLACAALIGAALNVTGASAQQPVLHQNVTSVASFVDSWQQRIINENLPVVDAKNWGLRNMAKFAAFSAERLELARQVTDLGELEAMLVTAPIATGTSFDVLAANPPGNIALSAMSRPAVLKTDPGTSPTTYSDLVFTMLNPCRIFDSRVVAGGAGPFINGASRTVKIGPYPAAGGGYATGGGAQGGSATGCGLDTLAASNAIKGVMLAVSTVNQTNNGYLTFYPSTLADPSLSVVSMWYRLGFIQTSFVVAATDSVAPVWITGIARQANTEVIIDIVGYFAKRHAAALDCTTVLGTPTAVPAGSGGWTVSGAACATEYSRVAISCDIAAFGAHQQGNDITTNNCYYSNPSGGAVNVTVQSRCCRVPGR